MILLFNVNILKYLEMGLPNVVSMKVNCQLTSIDLSICAIICTRQEIQCLLYAGFLHCHLFKSPDLGLELPLQSAQSIAAWVGSQDDGGKMNIDLPKGRPAKRHIFLPNQGLGQNQFTWEKQLICQENLQKVGKPIIKVTKKMLKWRQNVFQITWKSALLQKNIFFLTKLGSILDRFYPRKPNFTWPLVARSHVLAPLPKRWNSYGKGL